MGSTSRGSSGKNEPKSRVRSAKQGRAAGFPALARSSLLGAADWRAMFPDALCSHLLSQAGPSRTGLLLLPAEKKASATKQEDGPQKQDQREQEEGRGAVALTCTAGTQNHRDGPIAGCVTEDFGFGSGAILLGAVDD